MEFPKTAGSTLSTTVKSTTRFVSGVFSLGVGLVVFGLTVTMLTENKNDVRNVSQNYYVSLGVSAGMLGLILLFSLLETMFSMKKDSMGSSVPGWASIKTIMTVYVGVVSILYSAKADNSDISVSNAIMAFLLAGGSVAPLMTLSA